jgi:hypothetical protein
MIMGIALEWKQPYEYVLELPDMNAIWDTLDIYNPEDDENNGLPSAEERRKKIEAVRKARSEKLKRENRKS